MSQLQSNCPRCGVSNTSFDLKAQSVTSISRTRLGALMNLEVFCICRSCKSSTIFVVQQLEEGHQYEKPIHEGLMKQAGSANEWVKVIRPISIRDNNPIKPPEFIPENIKTIFNEGAACMAIKCFNAAATMFRLCLDLTSKSLLPTEGEGINYRVKNVLASRLEWLFENGVIDRSLADLASCIKDDGNDGAHDGTLSQHDAEDILDFTIALLERIYTEPAKLRLAADRRAARRRTIG